jgi:uncharacterized protein (TIGR03083 family)
MDEVKAAVAAERRDMADVLGGLSEEQWDAPTLCDGWRVREVVAHTTLAYRASLPKVMFELLKARGDINRMSDRCARRDAKRMTSAELLACLRDNVEHPWAPPGGGPTAALSHEVIHGLDITVGLGLPRRVPVERVKIVLDGLRPKNVAFFGTDLDGVELRATDLDWSFGSGKPVEGLAQDLLLAICGRRLPADRLIGTEAGRFTRTA